MAGKKWQNEFVDEVNFFHSVVYFNVRYSQLSRRSLHAGCSEGKFDFFQGQLYSVAFLYHKLPLLLLNISFSEIFCKYKHYFSNMQAFPILILNN